MTHTLEENLELADEGLTRAAAMWLAMRTTYGSGRVPSQYEEALDRAMADYKRAARKVEKARPIPGQMTVDECIATS